MTAQSNRGIMTQRISPVPSDLEIAQAAVIRPITEVSDRIGIDRRHLIPYGHDKAKVHLDVLE